MNGRMYASAAEKQKAYRDRLRAGGLVLAAPRQAEPKRPSRPARLAAIEAALRELAVEYSTWLEAMPGNLAESPLAEQLSEMTESLDAIADEVSELDPPRIGRATRAGNVTAPRTAHSPLLLPTHQPTPATTTQAREPEVIPANFDDNYPQENRAL